MEQSQSSPVKPHTIQRSFLFGKLFSLLGLIPLGGYVIVHLYQNLSSLQGSEAFNQHLVESRSLPLIVPIAVLLLWVPIVFHGFYGLFIASKARPRLGQYPFFGNVKYVLQRLSGIGLLLFIPAHIFKTRIEPGFWHSTLDFAHMSEGLHEPLTLTVYLLGVLGVAYHLANGVWQFSIGWGVATTTRGMQRMQILSYVLFALVLAMGYGAIWGFYQS
jgi:succinate dehydrogenase / fumarate reductase cytochrome b subunit